MNKKAVKVLVTLQMILLGAALLTSVTLFIPLILGFVVGGLQLILGAVYVIGFWNRISSSTKQMLSVYWGVVIAYFGVGYVLVEMVRVNSDWLLVPAIGIPIGLAIFFVFITDKMKSDKLEHVDEHLADIIDA
ncbi:hypothetical protein [Sanyastnella coralliicola]|uniref:hypothetical protein n=1 Tax=Sanyastnella coralliicola TaxID=3069118 RepID=UPI0027BA5297|nr:hypothetical protein [Longitalea sp. SCSIO 12813]